VPFSYGKREKKKGVDSLDEEEELVHYVLMRRAASLCRGGDEGAWNY